MTTAVSTISVIDKTKQKYDVEKFKSFLNAINTSTGKKEFYNTKEDQEIVIDQEHQDALMFNREIYAYLTLGLQNDFQKQKMIKNLLLSSADLTDPKQKRRENWIIIQALEEMKTQNSYGMFTKMKGVGAEKRVKFIANTLITEIKKSRLRSDALKYKNKMKHVIEMAHMKIGDIDREVEAFLFPNKKHNKTFQFTHEDFINYNLAKKNADAVYNLPISVAEGFLQIHNLTKEDLLTNIKKPLTTAEKMKYQAQAKENNVKIDMDLNKYSLFKLLTYLRENPEQKSYSDAEIKSYLENAAKKAARSIDYRLGKICIILDNSQSSYGTKQKKFHPIISGQAIAETLKACSEKYEEIWLNPSKNNVLADVHGSTDFKEAFLKAIETDASLVFVISDGYENGIEGLFNLMLNAYKTKGGDKKFIQLNPVYASESKNVRQLSKLMPAYGIREENQLNVVLFDFFFDHDIEVALDIYLQKLKKRFRYESRV